MTENKTRTSAVVYAAIVGAALLYLVFVLVRHTPGNASATVGIATSAATQGRGEIAGKEGPGLRPITVGTLKLPVPRTPDLAHVQPEHFAAALDKDPSRIFEFVRDQIAYEPYAGCLRGPRGTLLALAGNSVDRAALLAGLLAASGQRVRFVQGQLPGSRVEELVASVFVERPERTPAAAPSSPAGSASADLLIAGIKRDGKTLAATLKNSGVGARAEVPTAETLAQETRDHYWVQWWHDGAWVDMDPSFATAAPGSAYASPTATFDTLPDALFHRVDISIRVEEYTGAARSMREVLHYSAKAADLSGIDLVLAHTATEPRDATKSAPGQVKPVLMVRDQQVTGSAFRTKAPHNQGGVSFGNLFGGGEEPAPVAIAVAESAQLEFVAPGGRKDAVTRELFDVVGPARRRNNEPLKAPDVSARTDAPRPYPLTDTVFDFFVTTGAVDAVHLEDVVSPAAPETNDLDVQASLRQASIGFAATSDVLVQRMAAPDGGVCRFYVDSPRVYIAQFSVGSSDARVSLDLRRDRVRAVGMGLRPQQVFTAQVLRGVVEGHLERVLVDYLSGTDGRRSFTPGAAMSTSLVFELAEASNAPIALLEKDTTALTNVPADGRARVEAALTAGSVAVAPTRPISVAGVPRFAWWQIDRRSGATIAVTDEGLHQDTVEVAVIRNKESGHTVVLHGVRGSRACAHPENFDNIGEATFYARDLAQWLGSRGYPTVIRSYWTSFPL